MRKCQIVTLVQGSYEFDGGSPEERWSSLELQNFQERLNQLFAEESDSYQVEILEELSPSKIKASDIGIGFFAESECVDEVIRLEFSEENEDFELLQEEYGDVEEEDLYHLADLNAYVHRDIIYQSPGRLKIYYFLRFLD